MRVSSARFAVFPIVIVCLANARAQQSLDPADVSAAANGISQRAEQLRPILERVHPAEWVAKGAPDLYVAQWESLLRQNAAVVTDMSTAAQRADADAQQLTPQASLSQTMDALFRLHRFDADLTGLLGAIRRYQDPELADRIEAIAARDQAGIVKLQQYALDLAVAKEKQLSLMDQEAQRCRTTLAVQPIIRQTPSKKPTGNNK